MAEDSLLEERFQVVTFDENSRIVMPFKPSLYHMCLVQIALKMHEKVPLHSIKEYFNCHFGRPAEVLEHEEQDAESYKLILKSLRKRLHFLPQKFKKAVVEVFKRLKFEIWEWIVQHERKTKYLYFGYCTFFWRSDGTIDRMKTAQGIVKNPDIDINARFEIACMYCLVDSIQILWEALVIAGSAVIYEIPYAKYSCNAMVHFWIRWMNEGTQRDWTDAAGEYLDFEEFIRDSYGSDPSFSSLFRNLQPEVRRKFFKHMFLCDVDDFRFCLYSVSNEEQNEIMGKFASSVLILYTKWPIVSDFLEIAEKSWTFLDKSSFMRVFKYILELEVKYFDPKDLAKEFWERCPSHLKPILRKKSIKKKKVKQNIVKLHKDSEQQ